MNSDEAEQAYEDACNGCIEATLNSSDGGVMPCRYHKMLFTQRTHPVIHTTGLMDGEWTHTWVDTTRMNQLIIGILEQYDETNSTPETFVHGLGLTVIQMTKEEFEEIPEL